MDVFSSADGAAQAQRLLRTVLHAGCGPYHPEKLPPPFREGGWRELRVDADPRVRPDVVAPLYCLAAVPTGSVDAVWCPHGLVRLWAHEVPQALRELYRVLRPEGFALITTPDLQRLAELVAADRMDQEVPSSETGLVTVHDLLFGHGPSLAAGRVEVAHHTGFSARTLRQALLEAGFARVDIHRSGFELRAMAEKAAAGPGGGARS
ncbi:MAG: methyltransferase domain-containing protein [Myxococcales bacterium]|nr:methyltransferase domain-containing protein [Myxococcota bacterium]MDW8280194.1 methyltransferase domain-containing protein [Myxococcales bacterium]